ncbi:receptor-like protein 43 [Hibiscus syriacus]|uniref:receptor-like protein 43 n=1 Tax=Hibiscus syriacus TaxID=106335 RepID=UPI0019222ADC|nr:receptor-like protein 43 [Hibiscus syriacus]
MGLKCYTETGNVIGLDLSCSCLVGPIPLTALSSAFGPIPASLSNLTQLKTLALSHNQFSGLIPFSIFNLPQVELLDFSYNNLLGSLPSQVGGLSRLVDLLLDHYFLSGPIPDPISELVNLALLDLSSNNLSGNFELHKLSSASNANYCLPDLSTLNLSSCNTKYYPWKNVETLNLGSNLLEGQLLVPPLSTKVFLISNNRLTGAIPSSMCNIGFDSNTFDLSNNNLSGAIPTCMAYAKLRHLYLHMNHFHGVIPDFYVEDYMLNRLNLNDNDFEGPVPKSLVNCQHLEVLNLGNNKINGTFPHWLGILPRLQVLALRSNHFHGRKALQKMDRISGMGYRSSYNEDSVVITMKDVNIELEITLTIFATIDMSSNRFEGSISETVGNLLSLKVLNFSHNHLTGSRSFLIRENDST